MLNTFSDKDSTGGPGTVLIAKFPCWTRVYLQVQGANTLRISRDAETLRDPNAGLMFTAADGVQHVWWKGPMYGIGSAPSTVANLEFVE